MGLRRYETARILSHKLRRAKANAAGESVHSEMEIANAWIGGPQPRSEGVRVERPPRRRDLARRRETLHDSATYATMRGFSTCGLFDTWLLAPFGNQNPALHLR